MHERSQSLFTKELYPDLPLLPEIKRPFREEITLANFGEVVLIDNSMILAYKRLGFDNYDPGDKILVARERTTPIKIERTGREVCVPYKNEEELRGQYGVLIISVGPFRPVFYVGEKYRVAFEGKFSESGRDFLDISLESQESISFNYINDLVDYNQHLMYINKTRTQ